ncbi:ASCH domain-containing protein [Reinekea sp.]|uniref:ASCH domain-containing protein n=1 Tax=Reinekea sp. TaxID=1970455 RepID=UPI002A8298A0|nr:ASCH domain-containing protein [Reinekea sp.]
MCRLNSYWPKTATCSLRFWYESDDEPIPIVGHLMVVTDWNGKPVCIVEIDSVEECKFSDVSADFAYLEGEGDRSLEWWRKAHWDFFAQNFEELNIKPCEDMMLVLEKFHVVNQ